MHASVQITPSELHNAYMRKVSLDRYVELRHIPVTHALAMYVLTSKVNHERTTWFLKATTLSEKDTGVVIRRQLNIEMYLEFRSSYGGHSHESVIKAFDAEFSFGMYQWVAQSKRYVRDFDFVVACYGEYRGQFRYFDLYIDAREKSISEATAHRLAKRPNFGYMFNDMLEQGVSIDDMLEFQGLAIQSVRDEGLNEAAGRLCEDYAYLRTAKGGVFAHEEATELALERIDVLTFIRARLDGKKSKKRALELAYRPPSGSFWY